MRVAIMGAGLSGLTCAIQLERHGVTPWIFETRSQVGDRFVNGEVFMSIFSRPTEDEMKYMSERHQIYLHPTANIKEFILSSSSERAVITGRLGFTNIRGRHSNSLENQLYRQLKTEVHFHSDFTYEQLAKEFTHVIVATGDSAYVQSISLFDEQRAYTLVGATVEGSFSPHGVRAWWDERIAPNGYGYLIPFSQNEANIVTAIPDREAQDKQRRSELRQRFFERVCSDLEQNLRVSDQFEITGYVSGLCRYPRIGNTFFTGNCFGSLMPMFGFGQFASMLTGIYAANDLLGLSSYEQTTQPLRHAFKNSLVLRRFFESLNQRELDFVVGKLNGFWGEKLLNSKLDVFKWASYALRLRHPGM